jgi:ATPase subunit of ABC transporter with duplicated ATPase domains
VTPGFSVGFLPQEPRLDAEKDVLGNVVEGVASTKSLLDRFEEVCNAMGEPDADFDKLLAEQSDLQDKIDHVSGWDLDRQLEIAMDALRLPAADAASRCAACCSASPTSCCSTSRRTISTRSRSRGSNGTFRSTTALSSR